MYLDSINTPLGITSKILQDNKKGFILQTPKTTVECLDSNHDYITLKPTRSLSIWIEKLYNLHAFWCESVCPNFKQTPNQSYQTQYYLTSQTRYYILHDGRVCITTKEYLTPGKKVVLLLDTKGILLSKKHYGNKWIITQVLIC